MKFLIVSIHLVTLSFASYCMADGEDSEGQIQRGDPAITGGFAFPSLSKLSIEKETLTISPKLIQAEYQITNSTSESIKGRISFPMPYFEFFGSGCGERGYTGVLEGFKLRVNGAEIHPSRSITARKFSGEEATDILRNLDFNDADIVNFAGLNRNNYGCNPGGGWENPKSTSAKINKHLDALIDEELVVDKERPWPNWQVSYVYSWDQNFLPGQIVSLEYEYVPLVAGVAKPASRFRSNKPNDLEWLQKSYCTDEGTIRAAQAINKRTQVPFTISWLNYISATGENPTLKVKDFTLNLHKENENQIISLCFDGHFAKSAPLTLSVNLKDYYPENNIQVLYLSPDANVPIEDKDEDLPISVTTTEAVKKQATQLSDADKLRFEQVVKAGNKFIPNQFDGVAMSTEEDGNPTLSFEPNFEPVRFENGDDVKVGAREVCPQISLSSIKLDSQEAILTYRAKIVGHYLENLFPVNEGGMARHGGFPNFSYNTDESGKFYEVQVTLNNQYEVVAVALPDNFYTSAYVYKIEELRDGIESDSFPKEEHHLWSKDSQKEIGVIKKQAEKVCK